MQTFFNQNTNARIKNEKKTKEGLDVVALLGSVGYSSGGGMTHSSPLKEILLGKVHPSLKVKIPGSFCSNISDCALPLWPDASNMSLYDLIPQNIPVSSVKKDSSMFIKTTLMAIARVFAYDEENVGDFWFVELTYISIRIERVVVEAEQLSYTPQVGVLND